MENSFENVKKVIREAGQIIKLEPWLVEYFCQPRREITVTFEITMDDGTLRTFQGFRVQYKNSFGGGKNPYKGGVRYHPSVTLEEVRALAAWMFIKVGVVNLKFGGAKGGIICDPRQMSKNELRRMTFEYIRALGNNIGPRIDVPAPDVYTDAQTMTWILDAFSLINSSSQQGASVYAVVTGKPELYEGIPGRDTATARGGQFVLEQVLKILGDKSVQDRTLAIQGYGNAGRNFAELIFRQYPKAKIVAVSDSKGGILNKDGLKIDEVGKSKDALGSVINVSGVQRISNDELLELDVDVLVPAALENQITAKNAGKIKAKYILELANGPTTPDADKILFNNKVSIIPDVLANAGGVTVSYFEWMQNMQSGEWTIDEVENRLALRMKRNTSEVISLAQENGITNRLAAYALSLKRHAERIKLRGVSPLGA